MSQDALFRKASLFIVTGPHPHLHIVVNDPIDYALVGPAVVLLVDFCTFDANDPTHDSTCLLNKGDHTFFKHATYVDYQRSCIFKSAGLSQGIACGDIEIGEDFEEAVYTKILSGFSQSPRTPPKTLRFLKFLKDAARD